MWKPRKKITNLFHCRSCAKRILKQNLNWFSSKQTQWLSILSKNKQNKETPGQLPNSSSRRSTPTRPNFHNIERFFWQTCEANDKLQALHKKLSVSTEMGSPIPLDVSGWCPISHCSYFPSRRKRQMHVGEASTCWMQTIHPFSFPFLHFPSILI